MNKTVFVSIISFLIFSSNIFAAPVGHPCDGEAVSAAIVDLYGKNDPYAGDRMGLIRAKYEVQGNSYSALVDIYPFNKEPSSSNPIEGTVLVKVETKGCTILGIDHGNFNY